MMTMTRLQAKTRRREQAERVQANSLLEHLQNENQQHGQQFPSQLEKKVVVALKKLEGRKMAKSFKEGKNEKTTSRQERQRWALYVCSVAVTSSIQALLTSTLDAI
jgi:hypothetical protein